MGRMTVLFTILYSLFSIGAHGEGLHSTQFLLLPLIPGVIDGRPVDPKSDQFKKTVRLSFSGKESDTDCTAFVLNGCVVTSRHCVKGRDFKKLTAIPGNVGDKGVTSTKFTDKKFLGGEAREDAATDLVVLKPETAFQKSQSFDIDDLATANPAIEEQVFLGGAGFSKIAPNGSRSGEGTILTGTNTVVGSFVDGKPSEKVDKDSTTFIFVNAAKTDFGNIDEADSGSPVFTMVDKKLRVAGVVSKFVRDRDPRKPSRAAAATALAPNIPWLKDTIKELKCATAS